MTYKPLISVIIPSFNRAHLIKDAALSVLAQTYKNIELIIVDDCSSDNTKSVVESICDNRIKYVCLEKNSGACIARNKGIEIASGKFISFNDSDDKWLFNKLETQYEFLTKVNADVVLCKMECKTPDGIFIHNFPNINKDKKLSYEELLKYNSASTQTLFGKAECFKKVMFDSSMPRLQDWDEVLRLSQVYGIYYQNEVLVQTFFQKDSISTHPEKGVTAMENLFEKHKNTIQANRKINESFFKKKASFMIKAKLNPIKDLCIAFKAKPSPKNLIKLLYFKFKF